MGFGKCEGEKGMEKPLPVSRSPSLKRATCDSARYLGEERQRVLEPGIESPLLLPFRERAHRTQYGLIDHIKLTVSFRGQRRYGIFPCPELA